MGKACSMYGERRGVCRVLVGKTERTRSLGRPRRRWIFRKWVVQAWKRLIRVRIGTGGWHL